MTPSTIVGQGSAGAPAGGVVSVQGVANGTALPVIGASGLGIPTMMLSESVGVGVVAGRIGEIIGALISTSSAEQALRSTTYNEPTANAIRSISSSSANDAAGGTGARVVRITYLVIGANGALTGPFTEDIIPNGAAAVDTVASMGLIESIEAVSAGSGTTIPAGNITLFNAAAGGGGTLGILGLGDRKTRWGHHYVPSNPTRCLLRDLGLSAFTTATDANTVQAILRVLTYNLYFGATSERVLSRQFSILANLQPPTSADPATGTPYLIPYVGAPLIVSGPARIQLYVDPSSTVSTTILGGFTWLEVDV